MTRNTSPVRCDPPTSTVVALRALAKAQDKTLGTYVRELLIEHVSGNVSEPQIPAHLTGMAEGRVPLGTETWERLTDWFVERGEDPRRAGCTTKQDALRWALTNGFR